MDSILNRKLEFYHNVSSGDKKHISENLHKENVQILTGFIDNFDIVKEFYHTYYKPNKKGRIVLCGINPGRLGAGKTGVPFLDYKSLSQLLTTVSSQECEQSAQFIWQIISKFGSIDFFDQVYLTNISWFGFSKDGKNLNYNQLSPELVKIFTEGFADEMAIIQPRLIIPLSKEVNRTLRDMHLGYKLGKRLKHPNYCKFPSRVEEGVNSYIKAIISN